jgi:hypothetical protein
MATATGTLHSLVAIPKSFDGTKSKYTHWKRSVQLYTKANRSQLPNDESKQLVALSYIQEGKAAQWADTIIGHMLAGTFMYNATMLTTPESIIFMAYSWDQFWNLTDTAIKLDKL